MPELVTASTFRSHKRNPNVIHHVSEKVWEGNSKLGSPPNLCVVAVIKILYMPTR